VLREVGKMRLRIFLSELRSLLGDLKTLGIVLICAVAYWLWFLALFTLFLVNALYAFCWLPLPLSVGIVVRYRIEKNSKRESEFEKAEKEYAKTKKF
jgi:hypothetical protein